MRTGRKSRADGSAFRGAEADGPGPRRDETAPRPSRDELARAEERISAALRAGSSEDLEVLGWGEISSVVAIETASGRVAVKRLPPFADRARFDAYRRLFETYLEELRTAGVAPVASALEPVAAGGGRVIGYCVQPVLDARALAPEILAGADGAGARRLFEEIFERLFAAVGPRLGLDAQLSNWVLRDGRWRYLDVTTPLLRGAGGDDLLDAGIFLAMLPWALRGLVRRFLMRDILDVYFDPRRVALDLLGNLHKERLTRHLEAALAAANRGLARPLTAREVKTHYARDSRLWALLLALRRLDRFWQLKVRRRGYPYLLPGKIER